MLTGGHEVSKNIMPSVIHRLVMQVGAMLWRLSL